MTHGTIRAEQVNPFILATMEVFRKMMGAEAVPGKILQRQGTGHLCDISGVIGLSGGVKGTVAVSFPKVSALKAANKFMETDFDDLNEEVASAIGELANIVAGKAKMDLEQFKINISLPSVIIGPGHRILEPKDAVSFTIPFACDSLGPFELAISLKNMT